MKQILFILIFIIGCKGTDTNESKSREAPKTIIYGDDIALVMFPSNVLNRSRKFDGTNGAMAFAQCGIMSNDFSSGVIKSGDTVILTAGFVDSLWYGFQDPNNQVLNACTTSLGNAQKAGARVIVITPIKAPASVYQQALVPGTTATWNDSTVTDFYANILKGIAIDLNLELVDLNSEFTSSEGLWSGIWPNENGYAEIKKAIQ